MVFIALVFATNAFADDYYTILNCHTKNNTYEILFCIEQRIPIPPKKKKVVNEFTKELQRKESKKLIKLFNSVKI